MDLHVTLAAGPGVRLTGGVATEEIVITRANLLSGEQLSEQLSRRVGAHHFFVDGTPLRQLEPGVPPLTAGAVIVAAPSESVDTLLARPGSLFFLVRSGPDAGKAVPLSRGTYTIGRSGADITIHDPAISRTHAVLTVTDKALTLRDRQSANGTLVDGSRVERTTVTTASDIRIGSSRCALVLADTPAEAPPAIDLSEPCDVGAPPPPETNRLLIVTAFLPLVLGIILALTTGMWFFLAFSALSAVTGLVPLLTGRRRRRTFDAAVEAAVAKDSERRRRAAPDAGGLTLAALQPRLHAWAQPPPLSSSGRYLRLGSADQPANVEARPRPPGWDPPRISGAPVLIPLNDPGKGEPVGVEFRGPPQTLTRVAHLVLLQLSLLGQASGDIACYGPASELPPAARFLPRVTLAAHPAQLTELLATGRYSSVVVFGALPPTDVEGLRIYRFGTSSGHEEGRWTVDYFPPNPVLRNPQGVLRLDPDYVRAETFGVLARAFGTRQRPEAVPAPEPSIPLAVALTDLITADSASTAKRWRDGSDGSRLGTDIGASAAGPVSLDLVKDGPHLLVAGTTGSGKSEFLRTLVLGLSLNHSPTDLNFLLIDFKGGSGLGALTDLPHVTGILTDLSASAVSRALVSIRAEVKRRETLFAEASASDYLEYRGRTSAPLPRLVTVIDEFRMLSDEVPGSVNELMRIASLGRSLGMHLVLATQRPQGAITSDIRANITASVALRMQSAMESHDVLESAVASSIPVSVPGRGYLRVAAARPSEFQTATTAPRSTGLHASSIMAFAHFLSRGPHRGSAGHPGNGPQEQHATTPSDTLQSLVASAGSAAQSLGIPRLHPPVLPPLPSTVPRAADVSADFLQLGLLDIPERQEQRPLVWDPARHSHLAFLGTPGSGVGPALAYATAEHLRSLPDRHVYLLDGDSSLRPAAQAPQVGAYVSASEIKRAARVLQRIAGLVAERLSGPLQSPQEAPRISLFISGWGRWAAAFRGGRFAWAEDALQDIVRDGEGAGVTLVISGERDLIAGRFFSTLPNRLYLPLGASPEALLSWPKLPAMEPVPGRALAQGRISEDATAVAQLMMEQRAVPGVLPALRPFPVGELPRIVKSSELEKAPTATRTVRIPIGVGGDDLGPVHLPLPQRTAALVVGGAGTGKSQTLDLLARVAPASLRRLRPEPEEDPVGYWRRTAHAGEAADSLMLVDDADLLPRETHQQLAAMLAGGARAVFAASPSPAVAASPALTALRINPLGVVLGPQSPTDGDIFGLRLDVDGAPPPGRGVLVATRRITEIQVAMWEGSVSG